MAVRKQSAGHVQATIDVSDIEIGAVELKDDDSDVRQSVALVTLFNAGYAQSEDGAHVTAGTTTDAAASSTVAEDATARTGIALRKGIKNILILVNAWVSSLGTTTDTAASSAVAEDATARTSIGLWKGIKNILILVNAKFTAGTDTGDVGVKSYTTITSGEVQGSAAAAVMPTIACKMVKFKAVNSNAGNVYIGAAGVTVVDGTTDATSGLELDAGEETGWLTVDNLNRFYRICDNAGDDLTYLALS